MLFWFLWELEIRVLKIDYVWIWEDVFFNWGGIFFVGLCLCVVFVGFFWLGFGFGVLFFVVFWFCKFCVFVEGVNI